MTLVTFSDSEPLTNYELLKLSSFVSVLFLLVFRVLSSMAVMKPLVQYRSNFTSAHNVFFRKARETDVAEDLVLWRLVQGTVELGCHRYFRG